MSKLFGWFGKKKDHKKHDKAEAESAPEDQQSSASESAEAETPPSPQTLAEPSPMPSDTEAESTEHRLKTEPDKSDANSDEPEQPLDPHTIAEPSPMPSEAEAHSVDHQVSGDDDQPVPATEDSVGKTSETEKPRSEALDPHTLGEPSPLPSEAEAQSVDHQIGGDDDANNTDAQSEEQKPEHVDAFNPHTLGEPSPMPSESEAEEAEHLQPEPQQDDNKPGFFKRLKQRLSKTSANLGDGLISLFKGKKIDDELFEELETQLLVSDVGINTTTKIIDDLTDQADRAQLKDGDALYQQLKQQLAGMLSNVSQPLDTHNAEGPFVILMVGVNGVGKTTTIGKLAKQFRQQGKSVMLAAGDTFRAAAVEQLQTWGERNEIPVIAQHTGADSASVIYDALSAAKARGTDILIADTAGRLQNKANLMAELEKIVRVMRKLDANAPHEIMLALDATTGQNALSQTKLFNEAVGLTGLCVTKLDGTAKGGVLFALADQYGIPIRYIGIGEGIDDLRPFDGEQFVDALFSESTES